MRAGQWVTLQPCPVETQPSQASMGLRVDPLLEGLLLANMSLSQLSLENQVSGCPQLTDKDAEVQRFSPPPEGP